MMANANGIVDQMREGRAPVWSAASATRTTMSFAVLGHGRFGHAFAQLLIEHGHQVRAYDPHAFVPAHYAAASAAEAVPARSGSCWRCRSPRCVRHCLRCFLVALGCEVIEQDPERHDRAMANTHALAFFIARGLVEIGVDDGMLVAPLSFQGMKHMLAAVRTDAGHLFVTIQRENPFATDARAVADRT